jgi:hypothetical protein
MPPLEFLLRRRLRMRGGGLDLVDPAFPDPVCSGLQQRESFDNGVSVVSTPSR